MKKLVQLSKVKKLLMSLNILQLSLAALLILNRILLFIGIIRDNPFHHSDFLLLVAILLIVYNSYFGFRDIYLFRLWEEKVNIQQDTLQNIESLNRALRSQRHDFLNHIQVIYGLVELEEYDELSSYLYKVYGDIEKLNTYIKTGDVAINALLQAKSHDAQHRQVEYFVTITTRLQGLLVPSWEICRCLGNLIDNAIYATSVYSGKKRVSISIFENLSFFEFIIENSGEIIFEEHTKKIFQPGFTTKGSQGEGMGLYIVKQILENYGGDIKVSSQNDHTVFSLYIPKQSTPEASDS